MQDPAGPIIRALGSRTASSRSMQLSRALAALCGVLFCASGLFASVDFCDSNLCQNGGTCLISEEEDIYCICSEGFTGVYCNETEKGPCSPNPCYNDGKCQVNENRKRGDIFTPYICQCSGGYSGTHCEISCSTKLGMEKGEIADSQISASSVYVSFLGIQHWGPEQARLHASGVVNAWTASNFDRKPWIQVDLLRSMLLSAVITQGASRALVEEYVKTFKVAFSLDGRRFVFIQDESGSGDKEFLGNKDKSSLKVNMFNPPVEAQYIRLYPTSCQRGCTLRFELLGCELHGCSDPLGLKNKTIPDRQITASSSYQPLGIPSLGWYPHFGRLDNEGRINAWTARSNSAKEWLQVDLGTPKTVSGIITQGARDFGTIQYVASYKVAYSNDGAQWTVYEEQGTSKVFPGNSDNNSHKKNIFETPFMARYVRVLPVSWHNGITMRLELLGC